MKLNPKDSQDAYQSQNMFAAPLDGTYHMVGKAIRRETVGQNKTPRVTITCHILKCVDGDGGDEFVGKTFFHSLWWNLDKKGNVDRANINALAMGNEDPFDPDDDSDLVKVFTGHAFQIKLESRTEEWDGKQKKRTEVLEVKRLSDETRKKYAALPDWKKIVGDPKSRVLEAKDMSKKGASAPGKKKGNDPFSDGDDMPF